MEPGRRFPLVSPWLERIRIWWLSRRLPGGDSGAVRELAALFCTAPDPGARHRAGQALRDLRRPEQADLLCTEALLRDHDALQALARDCGYLPSSPAALALWLFCTARSEELFALDPEDHRPLLAAGYAAACDALRLQARLAARRNRACGTLARALAGRSPVQQAAGWSYGEWEIVIAGFAPERTRDLLWLLAPRAPPPLALQALHTLRAAGWSPQGDDRLSWEALTRDLPDRWHFLPPPGQQRPPAGRPAAQVTRACFSPDGALLATGSCDGTIAVWRIGAAGPAAEFSAGEGSVSFLAIPPGNTCVVSATDTGTIRCFGLEDRACRWSREGRSGTTAFACGPGGNTVLSGNAAGCLDLLDLRDGHPLYTVPLHPAPVTCLAPAPACPAIACGHADGSVSVVRPANSGLQVFAGNGSPVLSLSFDPAGTECLAVYGRGHPVLWDLSYGGRCRTFPDPAARVICSARPAGGGWFATGTDDHTLRCTDTGTGRLLATLPVYSRHITSCAATPDGSFLIAGFHDGSIRIWRFPGGGLVRECRAHTRPVTSCTISPDGTRLVTVSWDGTTKLWRIPSLEIVRTLDIHAGGIAALAGPAGSLLAAVTGDGIARVIDGTDGTVLRTLDLYTPAVRAAAMSPDGTLLAVTGADASLRIWNLIDGSLVAAAERQAASLRCCTFLPGSTTLVTGGWDGNCRMGPVPDLSPLRTLAGHTSTVTCCTATPDGSLLVTGSNDTTVRLWRTGGDTAHAVLRDSRSEIGAVAVSHTGTLLATGNAEGVVRLYRLPYGVPCPRLPDLPGRVTALTFTRDGCVLAVGYDIGTCALFSVPGRSLIRTIPAHSGAVTGLIVLADDRTLASTGADGLCRFHALPVMTFPARASPADIPAADAVGKEVVGTVIGAATFHRALLAARCHDEIGICTLPDAAGCYDIELAG